MIKKFIEWQPSLGRPWSGDGTLVIYPFRLGFQRATSGTKPQWHVVRVNEHGAALNIGNKRFIKYPGRMLKIHVPFMGCFANKANPFRKIRV